MALTSSQLRDPSILLRPMEFENWYLRTMIFEGIRRETVLAGKADPTPFEPWRIASAEDVKQWRKKHRSSIEDKAAATKRDFYGMKGVV